MSPVGGRDSEFIWRADNSEAPQCQYPFPVRKVTGNTVPTTCKEGIKGTPAPASAAGLAVRELARQVGTSHSSILYWERSGKVGRMEFLQPLARALGVTVEEVLGEPRPHRTVTAGGKMGQLFEEASKLPHSQQDKVVAVIELFRPPRRRGLIWRPQVAREPSAGPGLEALAAAPWHG